MEAGKKGSDEEQLEKGRRISWDDYFEECPVCLAPFDDTLKRPHTLPCGHTFCTLCINGLKKHDKVVCPICCIGYLMPKGGQFPVCYALEALIRRLKDVPKSPSPSRWAKVKVEQPASLKVGIVQQEAAEYGRKIESLLQEQETKVLAAIDTCQKVQAELDQYQTSLASWSEEQQLLEDRLQALVDQSRSTRMLVRKEETQVATKKEEMQQGEQQLHAVLQTLRTVTTRLKAYEAIDSADRQADKECKRAEEYLGMFPNTRTITTFNKVRKASSAALEAAQSVEIPEETANTSNGGAGISILQAVPSPSITERLNALLAPCLKVDDLRSLTQSARNFLQDSLVFAVYQNEGQSRHARISFKDSRLYLHSLKNQPLPTRAVTVQMKELVPAAPPCMVFLDLAWPGFAPHRVVIHLKLDTPLGRQFLLLCTGQQGPSYANTRLWKVVQKGQHGEFVCGGDYENNDGTGGATLLSELHYKGKYWESMGAGGVTWLQGDRYGAQFGIITRDCHGLFEPLVFGEVVEGLEAMVTAAQHIPITDVTVVDCGVVLRE